MPPQPPTALRVCAFGIFLVLIIVGVWGGRAFPGP